MLIDTGRRACAPGLTSLPWGILRAVERLNLAVRGVWLLDEGLRRYDALRVCALQTRCAIIPTGFFTPIPSCCGRSRRMSAIHM